MYTNMWHALNICLSSAHQLHTGCSKLTDQMNVKHEFRKKRSLFFKALTQNLPC
jgi:hypothetical protein